MHDSCIKIASFVECQLTEWWKHKLHFLKRVKKFHWIIQISYDSFPLKQKSVKNVHSFFPPFSCLIALSSLIVCCIQFTPYNFLLHIPFSDWLIFFCGNLILIKKTNENDKNRKLLMKNITNAKKVHVSSVL